MQVAAAVGKCAIDNDNSNLKEKPKDLLKYMKSKMWVPGKTEQDNRESEDITEHQVSQTHPETRHK